jgi:negative regulator of flagellin synthesis FlgM
LKIDQPAPSATPLSRPPKSGSAPASAADAASRSKEVVQVSGQIHALPESSGRDFDAARVAAIREDIRAGRYQVNPERIASGLLDSVRDLLGAEKNK